MEERRGERMRMRMRIKKKIFREIVRYLKVNLRECKPIAGLGDHVISGLPCLLSLACLHLFAGHYPRSGPPPAYPDCSIWSASSSANSVSRRLTRHILEFQGNNA
ncbi:hypothetical protein BP00DRAFT_99372 [Aspergillus indologenus CBS 114.80]|uniref:Uncharacterized protein n=1 Tax=Aspergillus indologenus CBS 114.80 TaxID=1450541 RepID=A0A2V5HLZ9_9EURO|nr:hypothetical protein BP00DRAFT_99372 [Aspergillus indologenus CBS 114.80]